MFDLFVKLQTLSIWSLQECTIGRSRFIEASNKRLIVLKRSSIGTHRLVVECTWLSVLVNWTSDSLGHLLHWVSTGGWRRSFVLLDSRSVWPRTGAGKSQAQNAGDTSTACGLYVPVINVLLYGRRCWRQPYGRHHHHQISQRCSRNFSFVFD